ncbi:hypothetical protein L1887_22747 [Cichorium endivia]|nr:hypothetical protein L1887_22747 [Cichorium endivia]
MENCDFVGASTLVAGRVLISTCFEFPLEKEILIKVKGRTVLVLVKDEGWIDEIEDNYSNDNEESSTDLSDEEDSWADDFSDDNSINSLPENMDSTDGDKGADQGEGPQQAWYDGDDGSLFKGGRSAGLEKAIEGIENKVGSIGKSNSLQEIKIMEGTCSDEVARKVQGQSGDSNYSVSINENEAGLKVDSAQVEVASRNSKKWDGSRSMRMFNKLVRDRSKRRMFSDKGRTVEKKLICPRSSLSNECLKSRNSDGQSVEQLGDKEEDIQSVKELGAKIGFTWEHDEGQGREMMTEERPNGVCQ